MSLASQDLKHGAMVHCRVDPSTCATADGSSSAAAAGDNPGGSDGIATAQDSTNMKRIIDKDGQIKLVPSNEVRSSGDDKGFRRGMMPLRDIKMAWTLNEFVAMDSQYVFKIKRQEQAICSQVSLDSPSIQNFQSYLQRFQFARKRFAFLYGRYEAASDEDEGTKKKTVVEAIYEPPQEPDSDAAEGFEQLEDPLEDKVDEIAKLLGLQKVGWIFGHAPRDDDIVLTSAEIIMAAELQLEAADGLEETPFITIKVGQDKDGNVGVEAFQVSQQCMAMVAEEALEIGTNPGVCEIHETFSAIQEGKESKTIENNFFLAVVPIVQHTSEVFVSQFPRINRDLDDRMPSKDEMKRQLSKSGTSGWTFLDLLSDFNLLIYMTQFLDIASDFPKICESITDRSVPLNDGYKIIIASLAGLDGAY
eukprot:CAMPEP_0201122358 /NCGR_PEP_ID=MMETSP0850-20130426/6017_1 /ASSEMBLY_ACC=CAM_ASM_000622 /TAXON_ID=183588 /ORGANISM="Pseudo-nitzschia fraudulenta, Strain WWA7" /LENGTH=418 /DNA_ID=CAMNT_0047389035 /DNA_START=294 /DNA_END=1550 /DNA_ORIENTATION=+